MSKWVLIIFFGGFFTFSYSMMQKPQLNQLCVRRERTDTPLHWMVNEGKFDILKNCLDTMRENGALNRCYYPRGQKLQTPLHRAVIKENLQIIQLLFNYPISIDTLDEEGSTPLMYSVKQQSCVILKYLLNIQRANPSICNRINWSPVHTAVYFRNYKALKLLRKFGADVNVSFNSKMGTPFDVTRVLFCGDKLYNASENAIFKYLKKYRKVQPRKRKKVKNIGLSSNPIDANYNSVWSQSPQPLAQQQRLKYSILHVPRPSDSSLLCIANQKVKQEEL